EISQRLVVAQTVWLDAQDGADDIAHRRGDDRFATLRRGRFDLEPPAAPPAPAFRTFDGCEDALEQRILLHAAEELPPLRPIHADRRDLRVAGDEGRFEKRHHFTRGEFRRALPREEFSDAFVARDVA